MALPLLKPDVQICPHPAFVIGPRDRVSQSRSSPSFVSWAARVLPLGTRQGRWLRRRRCRLEPVFQVPVDLLHGGSTVPLAVISLPTPQLQVDSAYQDRDRDVVLPVRD